MFTFLAFIAIWGLIGVTIAAALARRGHNFWLMAFIGLGYGPLLVIIWFLGARGQEPKVTSFRVPDEPGDGWVDVLVGLDGRRDSVKSVSGVLDMLGPAVRRIRLVSVLDFEFGNAPDAFETDERRMELLERAAEQLGVPNAELMLTSGEPAAALDGLAVQDGFDVIVVGHAHGALARTLRGSTARRLGTHAELPVLIGPDV